ncbi:hypothetical protein BFF94_003520 [Burkholderia catarinensis]|nr:hypothetical protein BFF94_003520 [Burkholderia catarinensis]
MPARSRRRRPAARRYRRPWSFVSAGLFHQRLQRMPGFDDRRLSRVRALRDRLADEIRSFPHGTR